MTYRCNSNAYEYQQFQTQFSVRADSNRIFYRLNRLYEYTFYLLLYFLLEQARSITRSQHTVVCTSFRYSWIYVVSKKSSPSFKTFRNLFTQTKCISVEIFADLLPIYVHTYLPL